MGYDGVFFRKPYFIAGCVYIRHYMLMWDDPQSWHVLAQVLLPLASPSWVLLADPGNSWILGTSDPNSWMVYLMDVPTKMDDDWGSLNGIGNHQGQRRAEEKWWPDWWEKQSSSHSPRHTETKVKIWGCVGRDCSIPSANFWICECLWIWIPD